MDIKTQIIDLWISTNRPGVDEFLDWLIFSDFFKAPCSTKYHLSRPGGLAEHSLNVHQTLVSLEQQYNFDLPVDSMIIVALGHDLGKVNFYQMDHEDCTQPQWDFLISLLDKNSMIMNDQSKAKWAKELMVDGSLRKDISKAQASALIDWLKNRPKEDMPDLEAAAYIIDDQFPFGHGEKAVSILQDFMKLTEAEKLAIRHHMGPFAGEWSDRNYQNAYNSACSMYPLVPMTFIADFEATQLVERGVEA